MLRVLGALNRAQSTLLFKIIASVVAVLIAVGVTGAYALSRAGDGASSPEAQERLEMIGRMLQSSDPMVLVGGGAGAGLLVALVIIWLGLALTYLGLIALTLGVALPLLMFPETKDYGVMAMGVVALSCAFAALLQGMRLVFSLPGPIFAIASTSITMNTTESFRRTASAGTLRAMAKVGQGSEKTSRMPWSRAAKAQVSATTPMAMTP